MPRLVGKSSNTAAYTILGIALALGILTALEYEGIIDVIPGFGATRVQTQQNRTDGTIAPNTSTTN